MIVKLGVDNVLYFLKRIHFRIRFFYSLTHFHSYSPTIPKKMISKRITEKTTNYSQLSLLRYRGGFSPKVRKKSPGNTFGMV